jgi:hypothetical protein
MDIFTHHATTPLLLICLVNYSREREQDRTKKEVERKDRKIQKGVRMRTKQHFAAHTLFGNLQQRKGAR